VIAVLRYILFWFVLLVLAVLNGGARDFTYGRFVSDAEAHRLSVLTGMVLFGVAIWLMHRKWSFASGRQAALTGVLWAVMTEAFEVFMTCVLTGKPLSVFVDMHRIAEGDLWLLVVVFVAVYPWLLYRFAGKRTSP
jgi:hypothetical protein